MPKFRIKGPDGSTYEVTAPEGASEQDVLSFVQKNMGSSPPDLATQAAQLTPDQTIDARMKNDAFGSYLQDQAKIRQPGEDDAAYNKRLYGGLSKPAPVGFVEGIARAYTQGGLFGAGDEIVAGGAALLNKVTGKDPNESLGDLYSAYLGRERGKINQFRQDSPVTAYGTEIVGSIPTALATMGAGAAGGGGSLGGRIAAGAGIGAAQGATYGFNAGEGGVAPRLGDAAFGGAIGGAVGAAAPAIGQAALSIARGVRSGFRSAPDNPAARKLLEAFQRDGLSIDDARARLQAWEAQGAKPEALVDAGGDNVRDLVASISRQPGPGKQTVSQFVQGRQAGQSARINTDLNELSANRDIFGTADDLLASRAKNADPLYQEAFAANQYVQSKAIDRVLETPAGRQALKEAVTLMQNDMANPARAHPELTQAAREAADLLKMERQPGGVAMGLKLRTLDYVKQALWELAEGAKRTEGARSVDTSGSRAIKGLWAQLTNELDRLDVTAKAGPVARKAAGGAYKQARDAYAGPSQGLRALELGQNVLREDAELTARTIADLSTGDKELFRAGLTRSIVDRVKATPDGADVVKRFFGNELNRERIRAAFPSQVAFDRFAANIQRETNIYSVNQRISPRTGSPTQPFQTAERDLGSDAGGLAFDLATGNYTGAARGVARRLFAQNPKAIDPAIAGRIAAMAVETPTTQMARALAAQQVPNLPADMTMARMAEALAQRNVPLTAQVRDAYQ